MVFVFVSFSLEVDYYCIWILWMPSIFYLWNKETAYWKNTAARDVRVSILLIIHLRNKSCDIELTSVEWISIQSDNLNK